MRTRFIVAVLVTFVVGAVVVRLYAVAEKPNGDAEKNDHRQASSAVIVIVEGPLNKDRVGEAKAIRILSPQKVAALEAFFPNYHKRPTSGRAGSWEEGYAVYFDYPNGESFRVGLSTNVDDWSMGRGDFDTRGDFKAFVAGLQADDNAKAQRTK
jgi:hypothetical protein